MDDEKNRKKLSQEEKRRRCESRSGPSARTCTRWPWRLGGSATDRSPCIRRAAGSSKITKDIEPTAAVSRAADVRDVGRLHTRPAPPTP